MIAALVVYLAALAAPSAAQSIPAAAAAPTASASVKIVGVYPIKRRREPVALVELLIENYSGTVDIAGFSQDVGRLGPSRSQVPWLEHELNEQGTSGRDFSPYPLLVAGRARIAFFLHYPQYGQPLTTPFGPAAFPQPTPVPKRLRFMRYEEPD